MRFYYKNVSYDSEGWALASEYLPADLDLLYLKTEDGKVFVGWLSGSVWDGLRVPDDLKIKYWKKNNEVVD